MGWVSGWVVEWVSGWVGGWVGGWWKRARQCFETDPSQSRQSNKVEVYSTAPLTDTNVVCVCVFDRAVDFVRAGVETSG